MLRTLYVSGSLVVAVAACRPNETRQVTFVSSPVYDERMLYGLIEGTVVVDVIVSADGSVESATVSKPLYPFVSPILESHAKQWRFEESSGTTEHQIEFVYRLLPKGTPVEELGISVALPYRVEIREIRPEIYNP